MTSVKVQKIAAFTFHGEGGNPAGVMLEDTLPDATEMQRIAAEVGFSETAFAAPLAGGWRVRYFAPEIEVPFCGHATIALGAALADAAGDGTFALTLNEAEITVEGKRDGDSLSAALQSPATCSSTASAELTEAALRLFNLTNDDLDHRIPPGVGSAGANHLVLALSSRAQLSAMHYDLAEGRALMLAHGFATIALVYAEHESLFHVRNAFAAGGVYEDPATGAAAAALAGYLRDIDWKAGGAIEILQGFDMGIPSRIRVEFSPKRGESVRVSGATRRLP